MKFQIKSQLELWKYGRSHRGIQKRTTLLRAIFILFLQVSFGLSTNVLNISLQSYGLFGLNDLKLFRIFCLLKSKVVGQGAQDRLEPRIWQGPSGDCRHLRVCRLYNALRLAVVAKAGVGFSRDCAMHGVSLNIADEIWSLMELFGQLGWDCWCREVDGVLGVVGVEGRTRLSRTRPCRPTPLSSAKDCTVGSEEVRAFS